MSETVARTVFNGIDNTVKGMIGADGGVGVVKRAIPAPDGKTMLQMILQRSVAPPQVAVAVLYPDADQTMIELSRLSPVGDTSVGVAQGYSQTSPDILGKPPLAQLAIAMSQVETPRVAEPGVGPVLAKIADQLDASRPFPQ